MATTHLVPDQVSMNDGGGVPRGVLLLSVLQSTKVQNDDFFPVSNLNIIGKQAEKMFKNSKIL